MTFLSLTLDNIKTQGTKSSQTTSNVQNANITTSPLFNYNNNLYSIESDNNNTTPEQIKEKYQTRIDLLSVSADKYINKMEETANTKIETANNNLSQIDNSINEVSHSITSLKAELQKEESKTPQDETKITQLNKQIKNEENKLKSLNEEKGKNLEEIIIWHRINEQYKINVSQWITATTSQLEKERDQALQYCEQHNQSNFTPVKTVSKKSFTSSLIDLKKVNAEYNANPTTENKAKLAAQIKTVQTVFDASGDELNDLGIYKQIQQMMTNVLSRLELKL